MRLNVKRWGSRAAERFAVMADVRLWLDQPVETREEHGRVVIQPAREVADDLGALVAAITDANCHAVVEAGPAVGREAW